MSRQAQGRVIGANRREILPAIAHELQSPLAAAAAASRALVRPSLDDATRRRLAAVISGSVEQIARLVDDLRRVVVHDSDELSIEPSDCDVRQQATAVVDAARLAAPEGVRIRLALPAAAEGPLLARADPIRLREALGNLVENAGRYGARHVEVRAVAAGGRVLVEVADDGPGIPETELERVFEPFVRVPGTEAPGTGLGLYLARDLVRRMAGELAVRSKPGEGARFTIELPAAPPAET